jgi:hypothetical protein
MMSGSARMPIKRPRTSILIPVMDQQCAAKAPAPGNPSAAPSRMTSGAG